MSTTSEIIKTKMLILLVTKEPLYGGRESLSGGSLSRGVSVEGSLGGSLSRVGLCPGGLYLGGLWPGGLGPVRVSIGEGVSVRETPIQLRAGGKHPTGM